MEPIVLRKDAAQLYKGGEGVVANVLVDGESAGAKHVAAGWISFEAASSLPPHVREVEELIFVVEGTATILAANQKFVLHPGDAIYLPPGVEHQHINEGDETLRQIYIFSPPGPERGLRNWQAASRSDLPRSGIRA